MSLPGNYLDGRSQIGKAVMLQRNVHHLVFTDGVHTHRYPAREVSFHPGRAGRPDRLQLPDGGIIEVASAYQCQQLTGHLPLAARLLEGLRRCWPQLRLAGLLLLLLACWFGYRNGLPWLASEAARRTPPAVEQAMASATLGLLEKTSTLRPSRLPDSRQQALQQQLQQLVPGNSPYRYHLQLVDARELGPDIIPLPGGQIIVTDQLVRNTRNPLEMQAMLAHAVGHIEARHGLRGLIRSGGVSLAVNLFGGDRSTLLAVAPILLADMKYPADFEAEADAYASRLLGAQSLCARDALLARLDGPDHSAAALLAAHPGNRQADTASHCAAQAG